MSTKPTLIYFDVRGRAESIRLVLEEVGAEWIEESYTLEQWFETPPTSPFHRLPVYREGDLEIPETVAILNYLGRKHDLLGNTESERIRCDVTIEAWRDFFTKLGFALAPGMEAQRDSFFSDSFPMLMDDIQTWYQSRPTDKIFLAGTVSIADFFAFQQLDDLLIRAPHLLKAYDSLQEFHGAFRERPAIKSWLTSPRRHSRMSAAD